MNFMGIFGNAFQQIASCNGNSITGPIADNFKAYIDVLSEVLTTKDAILKFKMIPETLHLRLLLYPKIHNDARRLVKVLEVKGRLLCFKPPICKITVN